MIENWSLNWWFYFFDWVVSFGSLMFVMSEGKSCKDE